MKPKILIVDDEPSILFPMFELLKNDYDVATADNVEAAMRLFKEIDPVVVITDIKMPVSSGIELLRMIRETSHDTPVILMSGRAEIQDALEAIRLGAWNFISKPIEPEQLRDKIYRAYRYHVLSVEKNELVDIFDSINDAITIHDIDYNIVRANRAALQLLGRDRLEGLKCYQAFHNLDRPSQACPIHISIAERRFTTEEFFEPAVRRYLELKASPRLNRRGDVIGIVHIVRDITARKEAEKIKAEFLSNISHEFRTPLNGILGLAELLMDDKTISEEQKEFIGLIKESGYGLLNLVDKLLAFSKLGSADASAQAVLFDMARLLENVVRPYEEQALEKGLVFSLAIQPEMSCLIKSDPGKIREALTYILDNAVKFTSGGAVVVSLFNMENEGVCISVEDTGIGIPIEMQEMIFKDFIQVDGSLTRRHGGSGSGLSLAKKLIESIGGKIICKSLPGKGSTFEVHLPCVC